MHLPLHGRSHLPQGSDPIPGNGEIRFDYDNQGGYLDITTRSAVPDDSDISFRIRVIAEGGGAGDFDVGVDGNFRLEAGGVIIGEATGNQVQITPGGFQIILQGSGDTYVINDHLGSPLVTYTG